MLDTNHKPKHVDPSHVANKRTCVTGSKAIPGPPPKGGTSCMGPKRNRPTDAPGGDGVPMAGAGWVSRPSHRGSKPATDEHPSPQSCHQESKGCNQTGAHATQAIGMGRVRSQQTFITSRIAAASGSCDFPSLCVPDKTSTFQTIARKARALISRQCHKPNLAPRLWDLTT